MTQTLVLAGVDIVLPDRVTPGGTIIIEDGRISGVLSRVVPTASDVPRVDLPGHTVVPGFIDVHVHGLEGIDSLDGPGAVRELAARMPKYGVTAFSPTSVACPPDDLRMLVAAVRRCREAPDARSARVLPAHLESNFLNPDYKGAQALSCLRSPAAALAAGQRDRQSAHTEQFTAADILRVIEEAGPDVGIITLAPELDGAMALIRRLVASGRIVSLGHSAATFDIAIDAIRAGARQATHLFNRMPPLGHREPGLAGAVLQAPEIAAEIVCDGYHVHPGMLRMAIAAKGADRIMAITDGSAGAGLPPGSRARIGGRAIDVGEQGAFLEDNTLAGSTATMDRVFRVLTSVGGLGLVDAATLCATTPARELGLTGHGVIAPGAVADLVVLGPQSTVVETYIAGQACLGRD
ncbi:MAG: N-acetylglucosamine-6-phosphate deacetylase [Acidobacteria bacterium]|nr:N-acetylglucosamine-6-phosphate deacetylase [Acidobacteriota bacterium]